jgi:hypothetical protein
MKTASRAPTALGLVFDFNAFAVLEEQYGMNILDKKALDKLELTMIRVRQLVHVGLLHKEPSLTLEDAGKRVGPMRNFASVVAEIMAALNKSFSG